jgi:hypothetical protein
MTMYEKLEASPLGLKLIAAGFALMNTGGGCMAWGKETKDETLILIGQKDQELGEDGDESDWGCSSTTAEGDWLEDFELVSASLDEVLAFVKHIEAYGDSKAIAEDALNAICLDVQKRIGQTDGGLASVFFSGDEHRGALEDMIRAYILAEAQSAKPEDRKNCQHRDTGRGVCADCGAAL